MTAVLVRLDGDRAAAWLGPGGPGAAEVGRALERSGADAVLLGAERIADDAPGRGVSLDPSPVASVLAHHTRRIGLVVTAAPQRDHPFNLARRIASLDHLSGGRAGWLVGERDCRAPGPDPVWTRHRPGTATTVDAVRASRELWRSWPADTIVGDHERGVFAESHRVVHIDHRGAFDVAGPLTLPEGPQGEPVVLWWWTGGGDVADAGAAADALVVPRAGTAESLSRSGTPWFVPVERSSAQPPAGAAGVVVALHELPAPGLADRFRGVGPGPDRTASTLRARLGLPGRVPQEPGAARPYARQVDATTGEGQAR